MKRRTFIKTTTAAGAGAFVLPRFSIGQSGPSANSKLNIAMIGSGGIAGQAFGGTKGENIVALCDVDSTKLLQHAGKHPEIAKAKTFSDFRVMLDKMGKEIDGVCINTPDHTHFVATIAAMERGLHVCTQKPLTHNIWEARTLQKAKAKYKVITNMGNQGHTYDGIRQMREWVEADVFGTITDVHSWSDGPGWDSQYFKRPESIPMAEQPVPDTLNWDLWLGPAEARPYHELYHPKTWRGFNRFGGGLLADWFCHICDAPVWILDLYNPVAVEADEIVGGNDLQFPDQVRVRWEFEARGDKPPCTFTWYSGAATAKLRKPESWGWGKKMPGKGTLFFGDKQTGFTDGRSNHPKLAEREAMVAFKEAGYPKEKYPRIEGGGGPHREWVRAIKGEGPEPGSNFDYASPMIETGLLGVLAQRFGGRLEWDAKNMTITNRPELNAYVKEPVREGWAFGEDLWG